MNNEVEFLFTNLKETKMNSILVWLDGKKVIIQGIVVTVATYLSSKGYLDPATVVLISSLFTIFFGTAAVYTQQNRDIM